MRIASVFSKRSKFRALGDLERDKQNWSEAAANYRRHLLVNDRDCAIWVQLGHALKESGRRQQAIAAYREANRVDPNNHDALIALAHALKVDGDFSEAVKTFRLAVNNAGSVEAAEELERLGVPVQVPSEQERLSERTALKSVFEKRAVGFELINACDVVVDTDGSLSLLSDDPWLVFDFNRLGAGAPLGVVTVGITKLEPEQDSVQADEARPEDDLLIAQIYIDRGLGFNEQQSLRFQFVEDVARILIVDPASISQLRLDPGSAKGRIRFDSLQFAPILNAVELNSLVLGDGGHSLGVEQILPLLLDRLDSSQDMASTGKRTRVQPLPSLISLKQGAGVEFSLEISHDYDFWLCQNDNVTDADLEIIKELGNSLDYMPKFSFVMPVYNTPTDLLRDCIDSMLSQTYTNFEICIANDNSTDPAVAALLDAYTDSDQRVKVIHRQFNGHISEASNDALTLATGDFVALIDHDDLIPPYALFVVASYISANPDADILYSDEDKVMLSGQRVQPYFKSNFNKYLLYGHNMISHLGVYRRSLVQAIGGFRLGLEGSQDYDLFLRCYEQCGDAKVIHIPHVLYHWRIMPGSTALSADQKGYAQAAAHVAINSHFERTGMPFLSIDGFAPGCSAVKPTRTFDTPVTIIIPTRNGLDILASCIASIVARPHDNVEILIIDNGSDDEDALTYLADIARNGVARVLRYDDEFNFSKINNFAAAHATGDILCFLNNDTEVVSRDWINRARAFLSLPDVGAVGARLLFPDGMLQHFGIALGMGAHRVAGTPHGGLDGEIPGYFGKARLLQEVSAVTAACLFMRKADFEHVGGFEPDLRVAYNDVDLCLKVRARGLRILVDPEITLVHKESRSRGSDKRGERARRLQLEADWMRARWSAELDSDPYFSPNFDLDRLDFAYASNPRVEWPWKVLPSRHAASSDPAAVSS